MTIIFPYFERNCLSMSQSRDIIRPIDRLHIGLSNHVLNHFKISLVPYRSACNMNRFTLCISKPQNKISISDMMLTIMASSHMLEAAPTDLMFLSEHLRSLQSLRSTFTRPADNPLYDILLIVTNIRAF